VTPPAREPRGARVFGSLVLVAWILCLTTLIGGTAWLYLTYDQSAATHGTPPRASLALSKFREAAPEDEGAPAAPSSEGDPAAAQPAANAPTTPGAKNETALAGLHPHPDPALLEKTDLGPLPIIGKDGRAAWRVYARPFSQVEKRPRIVIILMGLGISAKETQQAIEILPGAVSLSFAPFGKNLDALIEASRRLGHEVLLDLPMEPVDFPRNDPGPHTLLTNVSIDQNLRQLEWVLSRVTGYVGVSVYMGSGFATKPRALTPILSELKARGLMLLDTRENPLGQTKTIADEIGLPVAANYLFLDREPAQDAIEENLSKLEARAKERGLAIGTAHSYPVTVRVLRPWLDTLSRKGFVLAPVSAAVQSRK